MTIKCDKSVKSSPKKKIKELIVYSNFDSPIEDKTRLNILVIEGVKLNEEEIARYLSTALDCNVTYTSYTGVKTKHRARFWTLWEKIKFLFE